MLKGDYTTRNKLAQQIASEGHFIHADINAAIQTAYNHLKDD